MPTIVSSPLARIIWPSAIAASVSPPGEFNAKGNLRGPSFFSKAFSKAGVPATM
ncbi:hypothetical protein X726_22400 [Mesorhizobium sp. L103C105A0]|nr:hypothetical protein X726_22400 [Mesorhizobium sp. L103C105A0]